MSKKPTYLALGDSYTIGEGVSINQNFPSLLSQKMNWQAPTLIAKTGWRIDQLSEALAQTNLLPTYDFISLCIGVNNQYQGKSLVDFIFQFDHLLARLQPMALQKLMVVGIPNYGYTPFGQNQFGYIDYQLRQYNTAQQKICEAKKCTFIDIYAISQQSRDNLTFLAADQLHPSALQYKQWTDKIIAVCQR
jgi:lysophospholipase L1-like esterase